MILNLWHSVVTSKGSPLGSPSWITPCCIPSNRKEELRNSNISHWATQRQGDNRDQSACFVKYFHFIPFRHLCKFWHFHKIVWLVLNPSFQRASIQPNQWQCWIHIKRNAVEIGLILLKHFLFDEKNKTFKIINELYLPLTDL